MRKTFKDKYGPWALITGAARGLGKAFSQECAKRGLNVVLVDFLEDELQSCAENIKQKFSVEVKAVAINIEGDAFMQPILDATSNVHIGLLCCNHAGTYLFSNGYASLWADTPLDLHTRMLDINLRSFMILIHHFVKMMQQKNAGGIVLVSSGAGIYGVPYVATYAATKAAIINFAKTLSCELKSNNIDVLTIAPGMVDTPGFRTLIRNSENRDQLSLPLMSAEVVAKQTLDSLGKKTIFIPGWKNRFQGKLLDFIALFTGTACLTKFSAKFYKKFFKTKQA